MKTYICTTGTSIANGPIRDLPQKEYQKRIEEKINSLKNDEKSFLKRLSAETNSLQALNPSENDKIYLIHSETEDGRICADYIKKIIKKTFNIQVELCEIKGLQVNNAETFKKIGLKNLFDQLDRIITSNQNSDISLNVTGGFKSVPPYITLYGMLKQLKTVYLFEFSDSLIVLPPLPIDYDAHILLKAMDALIKLEAETEMPREKFYSFIPNLEYHERESYESLIEDCGNENITISAFGLMLLEYDNSNGNVFLSPNAYEAYNNADAELKKSYNSILTHITKPIWRNSKIHKFTKTDLNVLKLPGSVPIRTALYLKNNNIYLCELFSDHNLYERVLNNKKIKDYPKDSFSLWIKPEEEIKEIYSQESDQLIKYKDEIEALETKLQENLKISELCLQENSELVNKQKLLEKENEKLKRASIGWRGLLNGFKNIFKKI